MGTRYEQDVVAWANEQAALLRAGKLTAIDVQHIAEEIEDVGKSEQRELASRMSVLLAHLLKWKFQPSRRSKSWQFTIRTQRKEVAYVLDEAPSLRGKFSDSPLARYRLVEGTQRRKQRNRARPRRFSGGVTVVRRRCPVARVLS